MIRKLWNSASGLLAQSFKIDSIANNVANVNTAGFKKKEAQFQDLMYRQLGGAGDPVAPGSGQRIQVGQGVKPGVVRANFQQGILQETGRELDLAIEGDGFFRILLPDGLQGFMRAGAFHVDESYNLVTEDGYPVDLFPDQLKGVPFTTIHIDERGVLRLFEGEGELVGQGVATLVRFSNPEGLEAAGSNLWRATENSGDPLAGRPGEEGFGTLRQKYLELSNVNLLEEMTRLILAQRAYEISSRGVRTADDMWSIANHIRK